MEHHTEKEPPSQGDTAMGATSSAATGSTQSQNSSHWREVQQALKEIDPELSIDDEVTDLVLRLVHKFSEDIMEGGSRIRQLAQHTTQDKEGEDTSEYVSREDIYAYLASVWPQLLPPDSSYMELANAHSHWLLASNPVSTSKEKDLGTLARAATQRFEHSRRVTNTTGQTQ